jgi:hypothetical protein
MMKIKGTVPSLGGEVVILGLSHANLDRLRADGLNGYIKIDGKELGLPCDIIITAAPTERDMLEAFSAGIKAGTKLHIDKRFKE